MSVSEILQSKGIKLKIIGEELSLSPREKVTSEIVQFAKAHKQNIMAELKTPIDNARQITKEQLCFIDGRWQSTKGRQVTPVYVNPYPQGTSEARQETLMQVMGAIYQDAVKKAKQAYQEGELIPDQRTEAVRQAVLKGNAKLKDFQLAVNKAYLN